MKYSQQCERNVCLSWDDTVLWAGLLGLHVVPVFYDGVFDEQKIRDAFPSTHGGDATEGCVVRLAEEFHYGRFRSSVAKFVRGDFVLAHGRWTRQKRTRNGLRAKGE